MAKLDPILIEKSDQLKSSELFVNPSDEYKLVEKQLLFLALAGLKPVAAAGSGHWRVVVGGRRLVADSPTTVGGFLDSLGLHYQLENRGHITLATVSLQPGLIRQMTEARSDEEIGRLYGYPETAIRAFLQGKDALLPQEKQRELEEQAGLLSGGAQFRLSKSHWQQELAIIKQWHTALHAYALDKE